ncbi:uncharacterized protein LOC143556328 [Bidens hawaiensis]|uniref:uncharacterized protein LOC143556328 n=1 Tax=Bidens hawaiensis TaxID=980011 RepID=UPI00404A8F9E
MALAFHQTHCVHYKVVCVTSLETFSRLFQLLVYSSDTGKWKICIESFSAQRSELHHPVYWNGAIHWAPDYLDSNFLYFKLDVGELQMLPVPEELVSAELETMYFGESGGHLHFISKTNRRDIILNVNVYEMLMDRSGWFKYQLRLDALLGDFPEMIQHMESVDYFGNMIFRNEYGFRVVDVVRGKEEDTFLVLLTSGKMINYNVYDKSFKELYSNKYSCEFASFYRYIETLSSF